MLSWSRPVCCTSIIDTRLIVLRIAHEDISNLGRQHSGDSALYHHFSALMLTVRFPPDLDFLNRQITNALRLKNLEEEHQGERHTHRARVIFFNPKILHSVSSIYLAVLISG